MGAPVYYRVFQQLGDWITGVVSTYLPKVKVFGSDGTNDRQLKTDNQGVAQVYDSSSKSVLDTIAGKDFATQTTAAAIAADIVLIKGYIDGLEAKLDTISTNTGAGATQTTSAAIAADLVLIKGYVDAVESKLDTIAGKDFATQTTLAALKTSVDNLKTSIDAIKDTAGIKKIVESVSCLAVLSTDTKPTMTSDWRGNLFETDTQKLFYWSGTAWVEVV